MHEPAENQKNFFLATSLYLEILPPLQAMGK